MGCWNHTCAVTNLPIHWEEEVEVILLRSSSFKSDYASYCYPDTSWTPIPLTFSGTYNDYGAVENCHGHALDIIVDTIRENLREWDADDERISRHKKAITKETFDLKYMFDLDHDGLLSIKNPIPSFDGPKFCRIKHIVVRKDVYDGIVTKTKSGSWWKEEDNVALGQLDVTALTKDLDSMLDPDDFSGLDDFGDLDDLDEKEKAALRRSLKRYRMYEGIGNSPASELINYRNHGTLGIDRPIHVIETLAKLREEKSDSYEGVLDNALRFAFFNTFMNDARKTWTVPSGAGSQDDRTGAQELCARLTLSSAKAQRKWQKERYEE